MGEKKEKDGSSCYPEKWGKKKGNYTRRLIRNLYRGESTRCGKFVLTGKRKKKDPNGAHSCLISRRKMERKVAVISANIEKEDPEEGGKNHGSKRPATTTERKKREGIVESPGVGVKT